MTGKEMQANASLTPKKEQLIAALLTPYPISVAAKIVGINQATAHRWLKEPAFQQTYKSAQRQIFDQVLSGLMQKVEKAIDTLDRHMDAEETPANTQVRSAQIILEQAINVGKMNELEAEVAALRARLEDAK